MLILYNNNNNNNNVKRRIAERSLNQSRNPPLGSSEYTSGLACSGIIIIALIHNCHILPPSEIPWRLFLAVLHAQKGDTYFTELAERVEYGNYACRSRYYHYCCDP